MRDLGVAVSIGLLVIVLLAWVGLGDEILNAVRGEGGEPQRLELAVAVTDGATEAPIQGAKVVLATLNSRTEALDQYTIVGRKLTNPDGQAAFEVAIVQDRALVIVEAPGYAPYRVAAPDLWTASRYTTDGFLLAAALEPN